MAEAYQKLEPANYLATQCFEAENGSYLAYTLHECAVQKNGYFKERRSFVIEYVYVNTPK